MIMTMINESLFEELVLLPLFHIDRTWTKQLQTSVAVYCKYKEVRTPRLLQNKIVVIFAVPLAPKRKII